MDIKIFHDLGEALDYIELAHYHKDEYFKVEILKTEDGRWRVGIITEQQMELDI